VQASGYKMSYIPVITSWQKYDIICCRVLLSYTCICRATTYTTRSCIHSARCHKRAWCYFCYILKCFFSLILLSLELPRRISCNSRCITLNLLLITVDERNMWKCTSKHCFHLFTMSTSRCSIHFEALISRTFCKSIKVTIGIRICNRLCTTTR